MAAAIISKSKLNVFLVSSFHDGCSARIAADGWPAMAVSLSLGRLLSARAIQPK
jgi:hypothetical protein